MTFSVDQVLGFVLLGYVLGAIVGLGFGVVMASPKAKVLR